MSKLATPWHRLVAYLIDISLMLALVLSLLTWFTASGGFTQLIIVVFLSFFVLPVTWSIFNSFLISNFGGTIGKILTGTAIVGEDGKSVSFWRAFFRNQIGYMVSGMLLGLGFLWILIDKERRAWHDQIADTYVVITNSWLLLLGIIVFVALVFFNLFLISANIRNFVTNTNINLVWQGIREAASSVTNKSLIPTPAVGSGQTYTDPFMGFAITYPDGWFIQNVTSSPSDNPGIYFSPQKVNFASSTAVEAYHGGYVQITVSPITDWFKYSQFKTKTYANALAFLQGLKDEEKFSQAQGNLPTAPGVPEYIGKPALSFLPGAIELRSVRTIGSKARAILYWYVAGGKVYQFFAEYPGDSQLETGFQQNLQLMSSSFKTL